MKINESLKPFLVNTNDSNKTKINVSGKLKRDSISISNTSKAFNKLNDFMNLGKPGRLDMSDLSPDEKEEFMKMLAKLLKEGIVGYEIIEVNGKPEKHYLVNQIGDKRLYGKKLYNDPNDRY